MSRQPAATPASGPSRPAAFEPEWPTIALAVGIYLGFGLLSWHWHALSAWFALPLAACLMTLYGSLVHEVIHAHPTRCRPLNEALVWPCLWLWCPFTLYRSAHLAHHRDQHLTDPVEDPESYYLRRETWLRLPAPARWLLTLHNTLAGRLLLGPPLVLARLLYAESARLLAGDRRVLRVWARHLLACAPVLAWTWGVCGITPLAYLVAWIWPGIALTQVRSFAEHRAAEAVGHRTAVVETGLPFSLLYLNLNLHVVHHCLPGLPWYELPAAWRARREAFTRMNGGYVFRGYRDVARRFLLRPRDSVSHPYEAGIRGSQAV